MLIALPEHPPVADKDYDASAIHADLVSGNIQSEHSGLLKCPREDRTARTLQKERNLPGTCLVTKKFNRVIAAGNDPLANSFMSMVHIATAGHSLQIAHAALEMAVFYHYQDVSVLIHSLTG